jgi:hypothetical protein
VCPDFEGGVTYLSDCWFEPRAPPTVCGVSVGIVSHLTTTTTIPLTGIDERSTDDRQQYRPVITYRYRGEQYTAENVYPGQFTHWHGSQSATASTTNQYVEGND